MLAAAAPTLGCWGRARPAGRLRVCASHDPQQPVQLPGGALWWLGARQHDVSILYGSDFVIQRQRVGGEGLVRVQGPRPVPQPYARRAAQPLVRQPQASPGALGLTLAGADLVSGGIVIDTDCEEVPGPGLPCLGIVPVSSPAPAAAQAAAPRDKHPRRTRQVRFTCNLCGTQNERRTNPSAWDSGSVFARCAGCTAVHKLVDNLQVFHETGEGGVFPPRDLRDTFLSREVLDRIEEYRRAPGMDN